jgi:hypothetical protein
MALRWGRSWRDFSRAADYLRLNYGFVCALPDHCRTSAERMKDSKQVIIPDIERYTSARFRQFHKGTTSAQSCDNASDHTIWRKLRLGPLEFSALQSSRILDSIGRANLSRKISFMCSGQFSFSCVTYTPGCDLQRICFSSVISDHNDGIG